MSCQVVGLHVNATPLPPSLGSALPLSGSRTEGQQDRGGRGGHPAARSFPSPFLPAAGSAESLTQESVRLGVIKQLRWLCFLTGLAFLLKDLVPERLALEESSQQKS